MADDDAGALWVASRRTSDRGDYGVELSVAGLAWILDQRGADRYARAVIHVAQVAAHDAAVLAELVALGVAESSAAQFVVDDLRRGRHGFDRIGTRPLVFSPVVSAASLEPIVQMRWGQGDDQAAQMSAEAATMHAVHVLEVAAVVELDAAYFRGLVDRLGLSPIRAASAVDDLARFRRSAVP